MRLNKKKIFLISGILISFMCTWLFVRKVEWAQMNEAFREANYIYILPTIIIMFLSFYMRAVRWSVLIAPIKKVSVLNLFSATMIGFMSNNVLPARVGEIIRPVLVAKKENIKITASFATVVMERIFDVLCIIIFASLLFFVLPSETPQDKRISVISNVEVSTGNLKTKNFKGEMDTFSSTANGVNHSDTSKIIKQLKKWSIVSAFFGMIAITVLFLMFAYPKRASAVLEKLIFFFPHHLKGKLINFLHSFISGLQILDNKKHLMWIGGLSLMIWLLNAACIYVLCYSFNIGLSFAGACFILVCLSLAIALPQAPGYIGVFHIAAQKSLAIFGVGLSSAQSYAITLWAISVIPVTLVGLFFLWREGMSLGEISKYEEKPE